MYSGIGDVVYTVIFFTDGDEKRPAVLRRSTFSPFMILKDPVHWRTMTTTGTATPSFNFDIRPFYKRENIHLLKIPLFIAMWVACGMIAWNSENIWVDWACYIAIGYLYMSMATFFHEATHNVLFVDEWKNWAFGIVGFFTLLVPYVAYRDDHLIHHRNNRTPKDTAAFTMGKRRPLDFLIFYAYVVAGVPILVTHFNFVHPFLYLKGKKFLLHWVEFTLHLIAYWALYKWAAANGVTRQFLEVTLWPIAVFGWMNSVRFICEHHGTPWNVGQIAGTRTVISNPVNAWFWNNINYHIGHHIYPAVPFYHLKKLHEAMLPRIEHEGGVIDQSYIKVFLTALIQGPETPERANRKYVAKGPAPVAPTPEPAPAF